MLDLLKAGAHAARDVMRAIIRGAVDVERVDAMKAVKATAARLQERPMSR